MRGRWATEDLASQSDAALMIRVARGQEAALAEIYRRYGPAVWGLARRITNDQQAAEEVSQQVFLGVWSAPERFDPARGSLRSWLLTQTHGRAVDLIRSEAARRRRQERDARSGPVQANDVEGTVEASVQADDVRRLVDRLAPAERDAILLTYFGGHTYREAAELLGLPEGTIKSRIRSALQRLRSQLDSEGVTP